MKYKRVEEVPVWKESHRLVLDVYKVSSDFSKSELFALTSQMRRSAASVPANITEGFYRKTTKELIQFLYQARGSLGELGYHLLLAKDLEYMDEEDYKSLNEKVEKIGKQLNGWIKSLKAKNG